MIQFFQYLKGEKSKCSIGMQITAFLFFIVLTTYCLFLPSCSNPSQQSDFDVLGSNWEAIEEQAKGSTVQLMMWQGDPLINKYMSGYVVPAVKEKYGIDLKIAPGQGTEIVKVLMAEKEAGTASSKLDLCWINGETFYQLRQLDGLFGPFTNLLPNARYIDFENPFIGTDFQQKTEGFECPWGNVQMTLIYDTTRTPNPPQSLEDWEQYWQTNPGKFTIPNEFTGMTLLKSWLVALAGSRDALNGPFDEAKYNQLSTQLWDFINRNKVHFWRSGETFPESLSACHQLFANGTLDFTMSNNDSEVDNKILQGVFPNTSRAYVPSTGSIQNAHYMGVPTNSANPAGALCVINFLISPEAQLKKMEPEVWGDGTVLSIGRLPENWKERFEAIPGRRYAPARAEISRRAIQEPAPEYMIRLYQDFRKEVMEQ
ncbi:MAG: ABC transporter substrate-binding protein [Saprospiraceae bacterium]